MCVVVALALARLQLLRGRLLASDKPMAVLQNLPSYGLASETVINEVVAVWARLPPDVKAVIKGACKGRCVTGRAQGDACASELEEKHESPH